MAVNSRRKVIVAMSGGVDSSVTAALLLQQGYDVVGVTLNVWPHGIDPAPERENSCCALSAVEDARRVADMLGIAHYTLNFRTVFANTVIADFAAEYRRGRTPNPCIRCNEHVKFGALLQRTSGLGADFVATGHYARIEYDGARNRFLLRKARDRRKDQSYVLYVLRQELLAKTLMPLGQFTKEATRQLAASLGLPIARKPESQEICFIPDNDYGRFLREYAPAAERPGPILDRAGQIIGQHRGIANYTVGQRRGLGLPGPAPRYVTEIDAERHAIVVGEERHLYHDALVAEQVNLISAATITAPLRVTAKVRYRSGETPASLFPRPDGRLFVRFDQPQRAITPGQAVVFYDGDLVVGGGTIAAAGAANVRTLER